MDNLLSELKRMQSDIRQMMNQLDIAAKADEMYMLEAESTEANFWNDPSAAQSKMQRISRLKSQVTTWQGVLQRLDDALELAELDDSSLEDELHQETLALTKAVDELALQAMLSGDYDNEDAILSIYAGAGGTEAQDWAAMLERMYLRWMEEHRYKVEIIDKTYGEEAGIKSVTFSVKGAYAYGYLQSEAGVHRLVRISPYDASARRHTSFAKVELYPDIAGDIEIEVKEADLRIDVFRSSGPGGQSVNTTDSAVRITHFPTGIVVQSQNQKSQLQNKDQAMKVLKARLFELELRKQREEINALKGENVDAGWGNQIRSYVLHPYQMVKDLRTRYETSNTQGVLDGHLDAFMESYLRYKIGDTASPQD